MDCSTKFGNNACEGGLMDNSFKYVKANGGLDTEKSYPYKAVDEPTCDYTPDNSGTTESGYVDIPHFSEADLEKAVATVGPVSVAMDASSSSFQFYKEGNEIIRFN